MCLTIPGRIISIKGENPAEREAEVDYGSVRRKANLIYLPEAKVGDYILVQAGFGMEKVDEKEAQEALEYHRKIQSMNEPSGVEVA